jgi:hypothetical protein
MASTYSNLGINLQGTGDNSGTWGQLTNVNLQELDAAIAGVAPITLTGNTTLAFTSNSSSTTYTNEAGRNKIIVLGGSLSATTVTVTVPNIQKDYVIVNNTGATVIISSGGTTTVTIPTTTNAYIYSNGSSSIFFALPLAIAGLSIGGTTNAIQYNNAGALAGSTNLTFNGTTLAMQTATALNLTATSLIATTATTTGLAFTTATGGTATLTTAAITTANVTTLNATTVKFNTATGIYDNNSNPELIFTVAASATNYLTIANSSTANNPSISATGSDTNVGINFSPKGLGKVTLSGTGKIQATAELVNVFATAATGTVNYYVSNQAVLLYTTAATGTWVVNIAGNATTTLNSFLNTGESVTMAHLVTQGATTSYYATSIQIDSTTTGVTTKWQGGSAPTAGNASGIDTYSFSVIKTAATTYTVLASLTQFK